MSELYASLSGIRIVSMELTIPTWGLWCADVVLATADAVPALCSLTVANLTMAGAVVRQAPFAGARTARVVGGFGGWRKVVAPRAYNNPAGLPLSLILNDLAADVGEKLVVSSDSLIGTYFIRESRKAAGVLKQLAGLQWWVDVSGVTRLGARPTTRVTTDFLASTYHGFEGRFSIATEDLAGWQPGATFTAPTVEGTQTVSSLTVSMGKEGKLRLDVLAGSADRLMSAFNDLVDYEESADTFGGVWEYSVTSATSATFDGLPTSTNVPLPPLVGIPFRPGVPGASFTPAEGSLVLVAFANRDPRRPVVVGWDQTTADGLAFAAGSTGAFTNEHAMSVEGAVNLLNQIGTQIGLAIPGPVTGAALAAAWVAILNAAIPVTSSILSGSITAFKPAITAALDAKLPNATGLFPGIGWPDVKGG